MKRRLIFILLIIIISSVGNAREERFTKRINGADYNDGATSILIEDDKFFEVMSGSTAFHIRDVNTFIKVGIVEGIDFTYYNAYDITVTFAVTGYNNGNIPVNLGTIDLNVTFSPDATIATGIQTSLKRINGYHKLEVVITNVEDNGGAIFDTDLPKNVYLELELVVDRIYNLEEDEALSSGFNLSHQFLDPNGDSKFDIANFYWSYIEGAEYYELEWVYVNNYVYPNGHLDETQVSFTEQEFRFNSTRIRTSEQHYKIPLIFDYGFVLYRLRPVGLWDNDDLDLIYDDEVFGKWTTWISGSGTSADSRTVVDDFPHFFEVDWDHTTTKNWHYQAVYAEEGKKKDVVSYYDALLRNRQTLTQLSSSGVVIVGETMYDNEGRAAVQILPVPTMIENDVLEYHEEFNINTYDDPYSLFDFDLLAGESPTCGTISPGALGNNGAGKYYGSNIASQGNWQDLVPDAGGYPFVQVEYVRDNSGRIARQSGVGVDYKLGSNHQMRYFYTQPNQEELDRMFGTNVGYSKRYKKNIVIDANGQISVSYIDPFGRVIATALVGDSPTNLNPLQKGGVALSSVGSIEFDLLSKINQADPDTDLDANNRYSTGRFSYVDDGLIRTKEEVVYQANSQLKYKYTLTAGDHLANCGENVFEYPYKYDLKITLEDECGNEKLVTPVNEIAISADLDYSNDGINNVTGFYTSDDPTIPIGTYTLKKDLVVNETAVYEYADQYLADMATTGCLKTLEDFEELFENQIDFSGCGVTCEECITSLGSLPAYKTEREADFDWENLTLGEQEELELQFESEYEALEAECDAICETDLTYCEVIREQMLMDVSPTGQYGAVEGDMDLSVFNTSNDLPGNTVNWQNPSSPYINDDGTLAKVYLTLTGSTYSPSVVNTGASYIHTEIGTGAIYTTPDNLSDLNVFKAIWENNWAESLIQAHPEHCYLGWCDNDFIEESTMETVDYTSEEVDLILLSINTFANAETSVLGNVTNLSVLITGDPIFNASSSYIPTDLTDPFDVAYTFVSDATEIDLFEYAAMIVRYGNNFGIEPNTGTMDLTVSNIDTDCDQIWNLFKVLYVSLKQQIYREWAHNYAIDNGCYNGCIGSENYNPIQYDFMNSAGFDDADEPCSYQNASLFFEKDKRFFGPDQFLTDEFGNTAADMVMSTNQNIYEQTGLCPLAFEFQLFLNALVANDDLTESNPFVLNSTSYFSIQLYAAFDGEINSDFSFSPSQVEDLYYDATITSSNTLTINIDNIGGTNTCDNFVLTLPSYTYTSAMNLDWNDYGTVWTIESFDNIFYTSGTYNFEVIANIDDDLNPTTAAVPLLLSGQTCIMIGDCLADGNPEIGDIGSVPMMCESNSITTSFLELFNYMLSDSSGVLNFTKPNIYFGASYLGDYVANNLFMNWQTSGIHSWQYSSNSGTTTIAITEVSSGLKYVITFPDLSSSPAVVSFIDLVPLEAPDFLLTVLLADGTMEQFEATIVFGSDPIGYQDVTLGDCSCLVGEPENEDGEPCPCSMALEASETCESAYELYVVSMNNMMSTYSVSLNIMTFNDFCALDFTEYFVQYLALINNALADNPSVASVINSDYSLADYIYSLFTVDEIIYNYATYVELCSLNSITPIFEALFVDVQYCEPCFEFYEYHIENSGTTPIHEFCGYYRPSCQNEPNAQANLDAWDNDIWEITNDCEEWLVATAHANALVEYEQYIENLKDAFIQAYIEGAMTTVVETFLCEAPDNEYHHTLYYYDQAGNLIRTVPPGGVNLVDEAHWQDIRDQREAGTISSNDPDHGYLTSYGYNALNQLVIQRTPDGGTSRFWYDALGRLVASQNAKQAEDDKFSYTKFDALGRIIEVGELTADPGQIDGNGLPTTDFDHADYPANFAANSGTARTQITRTYYDYALIPMGGDELNGRNRIGSITYIENHPPYPSLLDDNHYQSAYHYTYDIHGNVSKMVQEIRREPTIMESGITSTVEYEYDLVSGNVIQVSYNAGRVDQFYHRYEYDSDNRITQAYTSEDGINFISESKYFYYDHGPLARTEIGKDKVQGMDYAYTTQGWLKSVNGVKLDAEEIDMGHDGYTANSNLNAFAGNDAFGFALSYYIGDYQSRTTGADDFMGDLNTSVSPINSLFNGNISQMATALLNQDEDLEELVVNNYEYDQLNRITHMESYISPTSVNATNYNYASASNGSYESEYIYDHNGNILYLSRKDQTGTMFDNFEYFYYDKTNTEYSGDNDDVYDQNVNMTNKLAYVDDPLGSSIGDLADQSTLNYEYNSIGQLIGDSQEEIELIEWTVTGKVKTITRTTGSTKDELEFIYDPMGNRICKIVKPRTGGNPTNEEDWQFTYYTYDAGGNLMATYNKLGDLDGTEFTEDYMLGEQYIYGSSRIGVVNKNVYVASRVSDAGTSPYTSTIYNADGSFYDITELSSTPAELAYAGDPSTTDLEIIVGRRRYELTNHLGNVLEVLSDKKIAESGDVYHLCFDGTNQNAVSSTIDAGAAGFDEKMTITAWVKTADANGTIAYYYDGGIGDAGMILSVASGKLTLVGRNYNLFSVVAIGNTSIDDDQWHYVVGTCDNGIWNVYVDGVFDGAANGDPGTFSNLDKPFYVGGFSGNYLDGCIKEVTLWNTFKTAAEIDIEFENYFGYVGDEPGLKGYWKVNEGTSTNLNDLSSGNHDLTTQNSPTWTSENLVIAYSPDVIQWSDYYPFGWELPGRSGGADDYRHGFQSQEQDDEIKGEGNSVNYKYRMHDPRIGRFFAVDPLAYSYPWNSPYAFSANRVINSVEVEGLESEIRITSNWYTNKIRAAHDAGDVNESIRLTYRAFQDGKAELIVDPNSPELNITSGGVVVVGFSDVRGHQDLLTYFPELKTSADNATAKEQEAARVKQFYVQQSEILGRSIEYQKTEIAKKKQELADYLDDQDEIAQNINDGDNDGLCSKGGLGTLIVNQSIIIEKNNEILLMEQELESTIKTKELIDEAIKSGNIPLPSTSGSTVKSNTVTTTNDQDSNNPNKYIPPVVVSPPTP